MNALAIMDTVSEHCKETPGRPDDAARGGVLVVPEILLPEEWEGVYGAGPGVEQER